MKHCCKNCIKKHTCLMRSMAMFLLFVQTGRANELTDAVMDNFSFCTDCEDWKPLKDNPSTPEKEV